MFLRVYSIYFYFFRELKGKGKYLISENFSSIWLGIHLKRQKIILVGNVYREWQYLGQNDNSSLNTGAQLERFTAFVEQWETALFSNPECHLLRDLNLNFLEYTKPIIPTNYQSYRLRSLIQLIFNLIIHPAGCCSVCGCPHPVLAETRAEE